MKTRLRALRLLGLGLVSLTTSCGGASLGSNGGAAMTGAGGAVVMATAAATLWAVGGGCKLQGCPYGSYCDKKSGFCDTRTCGEGCPSNTSCNEGLDRCQDPAPASPPNDFLPSDQQPLGN